MGEKKHTNAKKNTPIKKKMTVLVMKDGTKHTVESENGRFYFTSDGQFRKSNPNIIKVEKIGLNANNELTEGR